MKRTERRVFVLMTGLLLLALSMTGCTLAGASAAPLTPAGPGTIGTPFAPETVPPFMDATATLPVPTVSGPIDAFGTLTAMAPVAPEGLVTPGAEGTIPGAAGGITPPAVTTPILPATATPIPQTTGGCPATHTVQAGENLFRIALRYGLTYQELAAANGITNPNLIAAGTVLTIPGCGGAQPAATSAPGTGAIGPQAGDTVDANGDILHTVQAGENLFRIALRYGLTYQELAAYNGIANPSEISVGQVIRIPAR